MIPQLPNLPSGLVVSRLVRDAVECRNRALTLRLHDHVLAGEAERQSNDAVALARIAVRTSLAELGYAISRLTSDELRVELQAAAVALGDLDR